MSDIFVEPDYDRLVHIGGRWMLDSINWLSEEEVDRIAKGYECLKCFQRFEHAFPEVCTMPVCGYRVRDCQPADFEREYLGVSRTDVPTPEDLLERDEEERKEKARSRLRGKGVWIPGGP